MRKDLAVELGTDFTCPMTTSIFTRIMAEKNLELHADDYQAMTLFWRLVEPKSELAKKTQLWQRSHSKTSRDKKLEKL